MMLLPLILLLSAQTTPTGAESVVQGEDITVTAERIRRYKMRIKKDKKSGEFRCKVKRSSGLAELDTKLCAAMIDCAKISSNADEMSGCVRRRVSAIAEAASANRPAVKGD